MLDYIRRGAQLFHQRSFRAVGIAAVDYVHAFAHGGKIYRFRKRAVAAAYYRHVFAAVQRAVAGGAPRNASAVEPVLSGHVQARTHGARGYNRRFGRVNARRRGKFHRVSAFYFRHFLVDEFRAGGSRLFKHFLRQIEAAYLAFGGIVVYQVGVHHLSSGEVLFEKRDALSRPARVYSRRHARRTRSDYCHVVNFHLPFLLAQKYSFLKYITVKANNLRHLQQIFYAGFSFYV